MCGYLDVNRQPSPLIVGAVLRRPFHSASAESEYKYNTNPTDIPVRP